MFVGPTAHGLPRSLLAAPGTTVLPPARRGDVAALTDAVPADTALADAALADAALADAAPGEIVIVDGRFGDVLAVGHREILAALGAGWTVWGLASTGAIRAAELRDHGMKGFGEVYRRFAELMVPDDEVAVLHGPAPDYRPFTEALVDLRSFLAHLAGAGIVSRAQSEKVADALANLWFAERTTGALLELCGEAAGPAAVPRVREELRELPRHRRKSADLRAFLAERAGRGGGEPGQGGPAG